MLPDTQCTGINLAFSALIMELLLVADLKSKHLYFSISELRTHSLKFNCPELSCGSNRKTSPIKFEERKEERMDKIAG